MRRKLVSLSDEAGQVAQLAIFHNKVDVSVRLNAVMEGYNVGMSQCFQNLYFPVQVFLQLIVQFRDKDGLDGDRSPRLLQIRMLAIGRLSIVAAATVIWGRVRVLRTAVKVDVPGAIQCIPRRSFPCQFAV